MIIRKDFFKVEIVDEKNGFEKSFRDFILNIKKVREIAPANSFFSFIISDTKDNTYLCIASINGVINKTTRIIESSLTTLFESCINFLRAEVLDWNATRFNEKTKFTIGRAA